LFLNVSVHIFVKSWIDLRQIKTKRINSPFYTNREAHFTSRNALLAFRL